MTAVVANMAAGQTAYAAGVVQAQDTGTLLIAGSVRDDRNRFVEVTYDLHAPRGIEVCRVTLEPASPIGVVKLSGEAGLVRVGVNKRVRVEFAGELPNNAQQIIEKGLRAECGSRYRVHIGAGWFLSAEGRGGEQILGKHQAHGGVARVGIVIGDFWELGFEASAPVFRPVLDSQISPTWERWFLQDTFYSVAVGRVAQLGGNVQFVPMAGFGVGQLKSTRYSYSFRGNDVQTLFAEESRAVAAPLAGVDIRVELVPRLQLVGLYRMHVVLNADGAIAPRPTFQHRPGVGISFNFR